MNSSLFYTCMEMSSMENNARREEEATKERYNHNKECNVNAENFVVTIFCRLNFRWDKFRG